MLALWYRSFIFCTIKFCTWITDFIWRRGCW